MQKEKTKEKFDRYILTVIVLGMVAIVAIVSLVLYGNAQLEGAPTYKEQTGESQAPCADDDPNNNIYVAGSAFFGALEYKDHCQGDYAYQYHCATSNTVSFTPPYQCPKGCLNGVCLQ